MLRNVGWLYSVDQWVILTALLLALAGAGACGAWVGRRQAGRLDDDEKAYVGVVQNILFGLLTLIMSFTLSFALERHETRRHALVREANAISSAYLRALTLPDSHRTRATTALRDYVKHRLALQSAVAGSESFADEAAEADEFHVTLWFGVLDLASACPERLSTRGYAEAISAMMDAHTSRVASLAFHIPDVVIWLLISLILSAGLLVGYARGVGRARELGAQVVVGVLLLAVFLVIVDADRPTRGLIQVPTSAMRGVVSLVDALDRAAPASTPSPPAQGCNP